MTATPITATVLAPDPVTVAATRDSDRLLVATVDLREATGWELKPEGLCRGDVCVPVADPGALVEQSGLVDLAALADALHIHHVVDAEEAVAAFDRVTPASQPRDALDATDFTLPDLDGRPVTLSEFDGRKKLLLAFASW